MNKMFTLISLATLVACQTGVWAAEPAATAVVTVDPSAALGPIRPMNSVTGGPMVAPVRGDQKRGNFAEYKAARIPFARTHDCVNGVSGGAHCCDIRAIFPDFDADENDPKNYDFVFTDLYLDNIVRAGTKPFFRLGETIEHGPKKYGALPPKDFAKWARICEYVVRHYNEGWGWASDKAYTTENIAWSNQFGIAYWEVWCEPDLDVSDDPKAPPKRPRCWGGTSTNYFELYEIAAKHLKAKFPSIRIGGPSLCGNLPWAERFLAYCRDRNVPLDFFSWHCYAQDPRSLARQSRRMREMLDRAGFAKAESILNEWNYVKGWTDDWLYTLEVESGRRSQKGAAFIAAGMIDCQDAPLDHLMFYDARPGSAMNGLFDFTTQWPLKGYYPFYAWSHLADCGTQVACRVSEGRGKRSDAATGVNVEGAKAASAGGQFRAVAARGADGSGAVFIARYSPDDNTTDIATVWVSVPSNVLTRARCLLTDAARTHTEIPLEFAADGAGVLRMQPNSFALVEW